MRHSDRSLSVVPALFASALAFVLSGAVAAEEDPANAVRWTWQLEPADATPGTEAELVLIAEIAPAWVVYSSDFKAEIGPQPARLVAAAESTSDLLGPLRSVDAQRKRDDSLDIEYGYFSVRAELRQRVRVPPAGAALVATLRGQACHETDGTCHLLRQPIRIAAR
jgi:thiol:disulfide interchange protein DsbD